MVTVELNFLHLIAGYIDKPGNSGHFFIVNNGASCDSWNNKLLQGWTTPRHVRFYKIENFQVKVMRYSKSVYLFLVIAAIKWQIILL